MKRIGLFFISVLVVTAISCGASIKTVKSTSIAPNLTPTIISTTPVAPIKSIPLPTMIPTSSIIQNPRIRRLWAVNATTDLLSSEPEMAIGSPDVEECGNSFRSWHNLQPQDNFTEYSLNLTYPFAVLADEINIVISGNPGGSIRVEVLDSTSGLGDEVFTGKATTSGKCPGIFTIPIEVENAVDTVILTFNNNDQPIQIDAVELVGTLNGFIDQPVFWRIPIPADSLSDPDSQFPGGIAADRLGTLFLANGRNGLYRYDVEGNLLQAYSVPDQSNLTDVAVDRFGTLVVADNVYQWFVTLLFDGTQLNTGGDDFAWNYPKEVAISPYDGNIYLLDETEEVSRIRVYTSDTAEWIRDIYLESRGLDGYKGLAFDADAVLYTIDQYEAVILKLDLVSGDILDAIGYLSLTRTSKQDFALDDAGNIYVLMSTSPDENAVYVLDPQGNLIKRFGKLNYDGSEWGEGTFQFPVGIAVTGDGRFVFICENGFLTAYRFEEDR